MQLMTRMRVCSVILVLSDFSDLVDYSPPDFSVLGTPQARLMNNPVLFYL